MNKIKNNNNGFAVVEIVLIVVVLVVIGIVALKVGNGNQSAKNTSTQTAATESSLPSKISSKSDVNKSIDAVDSTPIKDKLNPNQLDESIATIL